LSKDIEWMDETMTWKYCEDNIILAAHVLCINQSSLSVMIYSVLLRKYACQWN
jgi:hypothetical protein